MYCGDWEKAFFHIAVHECRQLLWHGLHIMIYMCVCCKYANFVEIATCVRVQRCENTLSLNHRNTFVYTNMATATRTYPESQRKYTALQVVYFFAFSLLVAAFSQTAFTVQPDSWLHSYQPSWFCRDSPGFWMTSWIPPGCYNSPLKSRMPWFNTNIP